jgi:hypothetical protein
LATLTAAAIAYVEAAIQPYIDAAAAILADCQDVLTDCQTAESQCEQALVELQANRAVMEFIDTPERTVSGEDGVDEGKTLIFTGLDGGLGQQCLLPLAAPYGMRIEVYNISTGEVTIAADHPGGSTEYAVINGTEDGTIALYGQWHAAVCLYMGDLRGWVVTGGVVH